MALNSTPFSNTVRTISGSAFAFADDVVLLCDTSAGAVTLTLQEIPANNWNLLWKLFVLDNSNNAGTNPITINAPSGQTINLASSIVINTNGGGYVFEIGGNGKYLGTPSSGGGGGGGTVTSVGVTSPLTDTGSPTAPNIGIPAASGSTNGYLSSTDWSAFNSKGSPLAIINSAGTTVTTSATSIKFDTNLTTTNVAGAVTVSAASSGVTSVGVTAPVANSGTSTAPVINMAAANGSTDGYLTQGNWTTFNNKGEPFDVAENGANVVTSVTNINFNTDFDVTTDATPNKVNIAIGSGSWVNCEGFEHQATITTVQRPQCRLIGNIIYFRGTAILPLSSNLIGTVYIPPSSTTFGYRDDVFANVFQGTSGLVKGCTITGNNIMQFNLANSIIPSGFPATSGEFTLGTKIYHRGITTDSPRVAVLTTIAKVSMDAGVLKVQSYGGINQDLTGAGLISSMPATGYLMTAQVKTTQNAIDFRNTIPTGAGANGTTHSTTDVPPTDFTSKYPILPAVLNEYKFTVFGDQTPYLGGFAFELDGLMAFPT
jgi:hypothetical protein